MTFNSKEIQFFEIERNIYDLYCKFQFGINSKLLNDLYFLFQEENIIMEKILFSHNSIDSMSSYFADELYIKITNYYSDELFREIITDRLVTYSLNRLSLNPFPKKLDPSYYPYVSSFEKRELEKECIDNNYLIIESYCSLCFVYTYYYLLQDVVKRAPINLKKILKLRQFEYIYENKILENYLDKEMKESELLTLSRLDSFNHKYEEIEKTSMDYFCKIINNSLENIFDAPQYKLGIADSFDCLEYEINIRASLKLLSDKNFYIALTKIKNLRKKISDEESLKKFYKVYALFLSEEEKRKKTNSIKKIKTV